LLAALRVVFEIFIVKKQLLACGEYKLSSAIGAFEHAVDEFHGRLPQNRANNMKSAKLELLLPVPFPCFLTLSHNKGAGRFRRGGIIVSPMGW